MTNIEKIEEIEKKIQFFEKYIYKYEKLTENKSVSVLIPFIFMFFAMFFAMFLMNINLNILNKSINASDTILILSMLIFIISEIKLYPSYLKFKIKVYPKKQKVLEKITNLQDEKKLLLKNLDKSDFMQLDKNNNLNLVDEILQENIENTLMDKIYLDAFEKAFDAKYSNGDPKHKDLYKNFRKSFYEHLEEEKRNNRNELIELIQKEKKVNKKEILND